MKAAAILVVAAFTVGAVAGPDPDEVPIQNVKSIPFDCTRTNIWSCETKEIDGKQCIYKWCVNAETGKEVGEDLRGIYCIETGT